MKANGDTGTFIYKALDWPHKIWASAQSNQVAACCNQANCKLSTLTHPPRLLPGLELSLLNFFAVVPILVLLFLFLLHYIVTFSLTWDLLNWKRYVCCIFFAIQLYGKYFSNVFFVVKEIIQTLYMYSIRTRSKYLENILWNCLVTVRSGHPAHLPTSTTAWYGALKIFLTTKLKGKPNFSSGLRVPAGPDPARGNACVRTVREKFSIFP